MSTRYVYISHSELYHHGVKGQKWGIRRYQNKDGSLTAEGQAKYYKEDGSLSRIGKKIEVSDYKKKLKSDIQKNKEKRKENRLKYRTGEISGSTLRSKNKVLRKKQRENKKDLYLSKQLFITKDQKLKLRDMPNNVGKKQYRKLLTVQALASNYAASYAINKASKAIAKKALSKVASDTLSAYKAYSYANQEAKNEGFENWKDKRNWIKNGAGGSYKEVYDISGYLTDKKK